MANTTNYNWETPDDTDLVKDGALAIRTLGSSIDTTTKALNPSTTLGDIEYRSSTANTNTRLGIGTTGQVLTVAAGVPSWATPSGGGSVTYVGCSVYKTSDQSISSSTATLLEWDAENFDTNTIHDNSTNNSRFTIPSGKDGYYQVTGTVQWEASSSGIRQIQLYKNGTKINESLGGGSVSASNRSAVGFAFVFSAVAGDYFQLYGRQDSGSTLGVLSGATSSTVQISYLGA